MGGGQVCLKWNSFHSSLTSGFRTLWEEDGLVDVTLASDGRCIQAHKLILSACSPFFREVFKANPCQHPVIILQDTHFSELESLLCFVYKGEVNIDEENLPALLRAAETLQIRGLAGASDQVTNELGIVTEEIEEVAVEENSVPIKRHRDDKWQSPSSSNSWKPHSTRTKKRTGSRGSARSAPIAVEAVLETTLSPERVPKLEPVDHDEDTDGDASAILSDAAEDPNDSTTDLFLGSVMEMSITPDNSVSASDTGQNNGTGADDKSEGDEETGTQSNTGQFPFQKLPYADLLPEPEVLAVWSKSRSPEQLACDLMKVLFSVEERLLCNVNGKLGKQQFNVHKVQLIREVLSFFTTLSPAEFEEQWKYCITKIDTANRGLKRNMVIRGRKTTSWLLR
ncbi:Broad-complex core protein isoforms 1/2/3/4/5 [Frankliniella fusca]|uniref:Broad-complex core protein isoforms 1/2/3/4/5 n=1 Tax=Frankliniella fusca TaxID=407009 RepID=A0AAE1LR60_9NEOP|nr:Broad-complex core protein isoforms 1/2/3/4/5 [Frankliniella fusca]